MENSRRALAQEELGLTTSQQEIQQQAAIDKELERQRIKADIRAFI